MDLIRKRQAQDTRARFGFTVLLAGYALFAIFTSVPFHKIRHVDAAYQPMSLVLSSKDQLVLAPRKPVYEKPIAGKLATTAQWWLKHRNTALLQSKLRRRRLSDGMGVEPQKQLAGRPESKKIAALSPAVFVIPTQSAQASEPDKTTTPALVPTPAPRIPVKTCELAVPMQKLGPLLGKAADVDHGAAFKLAAKNLEVSKQQKLAMIDEVPRTVRAGLLPLGSLAPLRNSPSWKKMAKPKLVKKISYSLHGDLFPAVVKDNLAALRKRPSAIPLENTCVADNIAGWSGVALLPEHKALIERSQSERQEVSMLLAARLAAKGFTPGSSVFMRIFKDKSELEVWLQKGETYALYHTYKICRWSGSFGPKLYEGDKQSPEGFYLVNKQLFQRPSWKWRGSFSIGYPNAYDKLHGRTGSLILVHGGCTSSGCFAMTNPVIKEVRELAQLARDKGQKKFGVHVYPFKLNTANLKKYKNSPWQPFWNNLKEGYDLFEETRLPPRVRVCNKRYVFAQNGVERSGAGWSGKGCYGLAAYVPSWKPASRTAKKAIGKPNRRLSRRTARKARRAGVKVGCNLKRASCRKFVALKSRKTTSKRTRSANKKRLARRNSARRLARKRRANKRRASMRRARAVGRKSKIHTKVYGQ